MKTKYDICIAVFNDLNYDSRAKNLIDCLVELGYKVVVFSIQIEPTNISNSTFTNIIIDIPHHRRHFFK